MKEDLSDLIEKIEWAKNHDLEARRMGEAGRRFANENLLPRDIFCYHAVLFKVCVYFINVIYKPKRDSTGCYMIDNRIQSGGHQKHLFLTNSKKFV